MPSAPGMTQAAWSQVQSHQDLHPGLLFHRFLDSSSPKKGKKEKGENQLDPLLHPPKTIVPFCAQLMHRQGDQLVYLQSHGWAVRWIEARLETRLAIGLGIPSPTENGLAMDQTHGIPVIPGSCLKGTCQDWALEEEGLGSTDPRFEAIFGVRTQTPPPPDFQPKAGRVIFFEALPVMTEAPPHPPLEADIMNPHYGPYYQEKGGKEPADYCDPVPIFFLTVKSGTRFRFALAARPPFPGDAPSAETAEHLVNRVWDYLRGVITLWGVGAKTAVGYGLFDPGSIRAVDPASPQPGAGHREG